MPQGFRASESNFLGTVLDGKYRIEAKLGSGGMGDVYRATRLLIGDTVAVKILHTHLARDAQAAERFRREAVMATKLRHRNVVGIYDVGISAAHNVPYILMELAEGYTLRQVIQQYRVLPLDFAVTVTTQVCSALDEAHALGIVHRDIKPENIVANQTTTGWYVKVLDFGIAKLYNQADIGLTQDGSAMGTPQYMSPEQCMGETLDARSDIYSVGIMLYEMLTGTVPFKSPTASAIAIHHVQTTPQAPRLVNDQIHHAIEGVILKSIWKQREYRQQKASDLARELIQAATLAFKSGFTAVPSAPVAAPNVEPEFDGADDAPTNEEKENAEVARTTPDVIMSEDQAVAADEAAIPQPLFEPILPGRGQAAVTELLPTVVTPAPVVAHEPAAPDAGFNDDDHYAPTVFDDAVDADAVPMPESVPLLIEEPPVTSLTGQRDVVPSTIKQPPAAVDPPVEVDPDGDFSLDMSRVFEDAADRLDEILSDPKANVYETVAADVSQVVPATNDVDVPEFAPQRDNAPTDGLSDSVPASEFTNSAALDAPVPAIVPSADNDSAAGHYDSVPHPAFTERAATGDRNKKMIILAGAAILGFGLAIIALGLAGAGYFYFSRTGDDQPEPMQTPAAPSASTPAAVPSAPAGMAFVPGGEFMMGSDTGDEYSRPAHPVTVKPFYMDITEVTNEDYKKFIDAASHPPPPTWKSGSFANGQAKFPVTSVNWDDANAYAKWAAKRLPTEEEWEFAARGTDGRFYPWGKEWKREFANANNQLKGMREVGQGEGKSPFGMFDMAGNAWEWTASEAKAYPGGKDFLADSQKRMVIRGGYWGSNRKNASSVGRAAYGVKGETDGYANTGIRCIKDVNDNK